MASLASDAETSQAAQGQSSQKRKSSKYGTLAKNEAAVAKRVATTRLNSTSTLFVDSTLAQPNNRTTIRAVAEQISKQIIGPFPDGEGGTVFDEPTNSKRPRKCPTIGETEYVIRHVFKTGQLSVDCNIIALVYLDRLRAAGVQVTPSNWRPLLCVCLMLASKIWDDLSMINEDFSTFLPFTLAQINQWEMSFLNLVSFNVRVKASEYAKYYFNLRQQQQGGVASSGSSAGSSSSGGGGSGGSGSGGSGSGGSGSGGSSSLVVTIHLPNGDIVEEYPVHLLGRVQETKPGINKWGKRLPSKKIPPVEGEKVVFHDGTTWRSGTALGLAPPRGCTSNATKSTVLNNQVTFFQGDITTLNVDAIQNAANDKLWSGGGICGAIFAAANDFELSRECSKKHPSGCPIGKTALTSGCQLHAKHVLHTVGPRGEKPALLESAYVSALEEAAKAGCDSVALCCISTGIFGYPPECAAPLAISTVRKWLDQKQAEGVAEKDMRVVFCLFLDSDVELYQHWMTEWFPR